VRVLVGTETPGEVARAAAAAVMRAIEEDNP